MVGTTGSGKTTLAAQLAHRFDVPHIELDALHWEPNWTEAPLDVFRARVTSALAAECWVTDGNYSKVRDLVWSRADTLIWLDYDLPVVFRRLVRRTFRRVFLRETLWNGNRETFRGAFLSRESLFLWALKTQKRRRREYPALLAQPEYAHLAVIHLATPRVAGRWLAQITPERDPVG